MWFLILVLGAGPSCHSPVLLSDGLHSDYRIVIPADAKPDEIHAAEVFRKYFKDITGINLPVVSDEEPPADGEIVIGNSVRHQLLNAGLALDSLGTDGFFILTEKDRLFISGLTPRGTLNGVYTFLEKYLGCRFYSPEVRQIPRMDRVALPSIKDIQVPCFSYREMHFPGKWDPEYLEWHKLHSHHDGQWGMWVHTFKDLVPAETYFETHPEFFTEINGKRVPDGQLCLSNPEVFNVLVANLSEMMQKNPNALYWSVSQNDNFLACQCPECKEAVEKLGGESGVMIDFVNRVAGNFPDKVISTLAYQYTRSAPNAVIPSPNVNIMLCSIECNRSRPIAADTSGPGFVKDVKDWTRLTDHILIWDYVVQFRNYISPFPNLRVLQPNLEFFADHKCRMMFQQGSGRSLSEFVELRSYMIAKLLWDPRQNAKEIMKDFLKGYYGSAAPHLEAYIDLLHDALEISGDGLWIYGFPYHGIGSFLRPELIPEYESLFDKAEKAVADEPEILARVLTARLPLDFAILDISLHRVNEQLSWFEEKEGRWQYRQDMLNRLDTFIARCNRFGINTLNEKAFSPEDYRQQIQEYLHKNSERHLGLNKPVTMLTDYSEKYEAGGPSALTDGLRGIDDYHFNWLGFEGNDLEAIIDLKEEMNIHEVSADFLQDIQSWIFLPKIFSVEYSIDGIHFTDLGRELNIIPDHQPGSFIRTFSISAGGVNARFIKARAESLLTCPPWHIGSGQKCWIFTDEIVIK